MSEWVKHEWQFLGGTGLLTLVIAAFRFLRSSSASRPPFWKRVFQLGSAIVRLQIADGEIDYLKGALLDVRTERSTLLQDNARKDAEITRLRSLIDGDSGRGSSAGSTSRRGASTRKKRTTSGTSGESTR